MRGAIEENGAGDKRRTLTSVGRLWSLALIVLTVVVLAASRSVGTKAGWPWMYWHQGGLAPWIYALACGFFGVALVLNIRVFFVEWLPPAPLTITLLAATGLLMKLLPPAESGIQILPCLPWSYSGWFPSLIAIVAWIFLVHAITLVINGDPHGEAEAVLFWSTVLTLTLSFWGVPSKQPKAHQTIAANPLGEYRSQVELWKARKAEAQRVLGDFRRDRETLVEELRELGVHSSADLRSIPAARPLAEELAEITSQIHSQEREVQRLDLVLSETESSLRRIERQNTIQATGLASDDEDHLSRSKVELNERLRSKGGLPALEANEIIDNLLQERK